MERSALIVRLEDREPPLSVLGTEVTVLADNHETGALGITFQSGSEGTGPGPHQHPWDEAFYVLDGSVEFTVDGKTCLLGAGSLVVLPGNTVHAFQYGPGGGRMMEMTGPGSNSAAMFRAFANEMSGPPEVAQVSAIMGRHGATLLA